MLSLSDLTNRQLMRRRLCSIVTLPVSVFLLGSGIALSLISHAEDKELASDEDSIIPYVSALLLAAGTLSAAVITFNVVNLLVKGPDPKFEDLVSDEKLKESQRQANECIIMYNILKKLNNPKVDFSNFLEENPTIFTTSETPCNPQHQNFLDIIKKEQGRKRTLSELVQEVHGNKDVDISNLLAQLNENLRRNVIKVLENPEQQEIKGDNPTENDFLSNLKKLVIENNKKPEDKRVTLYSDDPFSGLLSSNDFDFSELPFQDALDQPHSECTPPPPTMQHRRPPSPFNGP